eukprot:753337-Hanusia_phi.AAC.2
MPQDRTLRYGRIEPMTRPCPGQRDPLTGLPGCQEHPSHGTCDRHMALQSLCETFEALDPCKRAVKKNTPPRSPNRCMLVKLRVSLRPLRAGRTHVIRPLPLTGRQSGRAMAEMNKGSESVYGDRRAADMLDGHSLSKAMCEYKNIHILAEHALLGLQKIDLQIPLLYTEEETASLKGLQNSMRKCKSEECSPCDRKFKWEETVNPVLWMLLF